MLTEVALKIFNTRIKMVVSERKTGEIFRQKFCEHVIIEVKVLDESAKSAIFNIDTVSDHAHKNIQLAQARENYFISVPELSLNTALPYSVIFSKDMSIKSAGLHLKTLCTEIQNNNFKFNDLFEIKEPPVDFAYDKIMECNSSYMYFFLQPKRIKNGKSGKDDCPILRGMLPVVLMEHLLYFR